MQVAGNVFECHVSDARTPAQIQATQLAQILSHQLNTVVRDLGAAGQAESGQVGQTVHHVDHAMVGDLPAGVQP